MLNSLLVPIFVYLVLFNSGVEFLNIGVFL
ncbi:MAG: hypothetical protein ACI8QY_001033 [bacterium]